MDLTNFGGNVSFEPGRYYEPTTEAEVLDVLDRHAGGTVRVVGSGHAWSPAAETPDAAVCVDALDAIEVRREAGGVVVRAGGGATLDAIVRAVESQTDHTLPTMGGVLEQTIAGAISTGTHGSGRPSLSHYMDEIRTAAYDPASGEARVFTFDGGEALRAARCAVGRMGVIVSVTFRCVPKYLVAETVREVDSVSDLLDRDRPDSLEQAILLPHSWRLVVFDRRVVHDTLSTLGRIRAAIRSAASVAYVDIGLHLVVIAVVFAVRHGLAGLGLVSGLYRAVVPRAIRTDVTRTGPSTAMLTLRHDLFRHLEMELFVPKRDLPRATDVVTHIVSVAAGGDTPAPGADVRQVLRGAGTEGAVERLRGTYVHHYPVSLRRVPPDDTLISMAAGDGEPYYALSFFTYYPPGARGAFFDLCHVVAKTLADELDARPHWGKYNPLEYEDIAPLYPHLAAFHRQCEAVDPDGTFGNDYTRRTMGI